MEDVDEVEDVDEEEVDVDVSEELLSVDVEEPVVSLGGGGGGGGGLPGLGPGGGGGLGFEEGALVGCADGVGDLLEPQARGSMGTVPRKPRH